MKKSYSLYFLSFFILFVFSCSKKQAIKTTSDMEILNINSEEAEDVQLDADMNQAIESQSIDQVKISNDGLELLIEENLKKINRLNAELTYLKDNYIELESKSKYWTDPLYLYNKKIILDNGTYIFGNIIYQDNEVINVETLIGTLSLVRESIVRVVDFQVETIEDELDVIDVVKNTPSATLPVEDLVQPIAEIVLFGEFLENKDTNNNTILSGQVKNIGGKQADFIKINFTIYKDRNSTDKPKEYTVFIEGSTQMFANDIASNSSLKPNEIGSFKLVIPSDFGSFISYSYNIDWEQYD